MAGTCSSLPIHLLNWSKVENTEVIYLYSNATNYIVRSLLGKDYSSIEEIDQDLCIVSQKLLEAGRFLTLKK